MAWDTLFLTDNDLILLAKFKAVQRGQTGRPTKFQATDGREGVCGGMSAMWLKNMFNKHDAECRPSPHSSAIIHANSEFFNADIWNENVLELAGLSIVQRKKLPFSDAIAWMMAENGSYYFSTGNHAMAAVKRNSVYYFFNPSHGALKTTDPETFLDLAPGLHRAYLMIPRYKILWELFKVREKS